MLAFFALLVRDVLNKQEFWILSLTDFIIIYSLEGQHELIQLEVLLLVEPGKAAILSSLAIFFLLLSYLLLARLDHIAHAIDMVSKLKVIMLGVIVLVEGRVSEQLFHVLFALRILYSPIAHLVLAPITGIRGFYKLLT